jgi:Carbonic anhydrase
MELCNLNLKTFRCAKVQPEFIDPEHIEYSEDKSTWYKYPNYDSVERTPINVDVEKTMMTNKHLLYISYSANTLGYFFNNGHTIEFYVKNRVSFIQVYDKESNSYKKFYLKQFHFHNPSENSINDRFYPLELHFVHERYNKKINTYEHVVVALLFQLSKERNQIPFLNYAFRPKFFKKLTRVNLSIFNSLTNNTYYYFPGTLTTPPFSRISDGWFLFFYDQVKNIKLTINETTYQQFLKFYENNRAPISPHTHNRYADPLDKNYLAITKVNPEHY